MNSARKPNWVHAQRRRTGQSQGAVTESEREELARLRADKARWAKEKAELEMSLMCSSAPWSAG